LILVFAGEELSVFQEQVCDERSAFSFLFPYFLSINIVHFHRKKKILFGWLLPHRLSKFNGNAKYKAMRFSHRNQIQNAITIKIRKHSFAAKKTSVSRFRSANIEDSREKGNGRTSVSWHPRRNWPKESVLNLFAQGKCP